MVDFYTYLILSTFFFLRSYLKSSREDPMPKAGGCRGWRITSQWWKKACSFILLSYRTLQKRARRDNFHYLFERNLHFVFLPSRTLEILQLATETSVIMKTKLKFAEDIDVRPCAELRTSPSAANLFARSTWIRDNFLTNLSFLYIGFVLMKNLKMEFSSIMD